MQTAVTYLEMTQLPAQPVPTPPRTDVLIAQAISPTISFYRYLYDTVGERWLWLDRRRLIDEQLASIVQDPAVEIYVLHAGGVPAGYAELDRRRPPDIELAYFGIMPEFIGQRLGPYLLRWSVEKAFSYSPRRLWVHTCTLDHPKALRTYLNAGFRIYEEKIEIAGESRL